MCPSPSTTWNVSRKSRQNPERVRAPEHGSFRSFLLTPIQAPLAQFSLTDPSAIAGGTSYSFVTHTGYNYAAQYATPLLGSNAWSTFTNVAGNGSIVRVTNAATYDAKRFYRVMAQ